MNLWRVDMHYFIFLLMFFLVPLQICFADPWGKDAGLVNGPCREECPGCHGPLQVFGEACVRFHQDVISPCDGPRSHYLPSSSQYTIEAMQKYGFFMGVAMGCDRLMRESDDKWIYRTRRSPTGMLMKYDPVP